MISDGYEHFMKSAHQNSPFFGPNSGLLTSNIETKTGLIGVAHRTPPQANIKY